MARKKSSGRKKPNKVICLWLLLLSLFAVSMVALFYFIFLRPGTISTDSSLPSPEYEKNLATIFEDSPPHHPLLTPRPLKVRPPQTKKARIAIVIDDMGYHNNVARQLLALDLDLSFAFLPYGPHTDSHLSLAAKKGRDILLHLPMEPRDSKWNPGKGTLLTSMNGKKIAQTISNNLSAVPSAIGVNNHMGSHFTEVKPAMQACLQVLKPKNLFFLDSLTTANSKGFQTAREMGVKTAKRDIFLDNIQTAEAIRKQLESLVAIAKKYGTAIAIGHPYQATVDALLANQAILHNEVVLVGVSELMN